MKQFWEERVALLERKLVLADAGFEKEVEEAASAFESALCESDLATKMSLIEKTIDSIKFSRSAVQELMLELEQARECCKQAKEKELAKENAREVLFGGNEENKE